MSLLFGWSEVSITPDRKISLAGQFAERISEYVEKLRIERAIELLGDSSRTIEEIALEVGYASDKSFRRAFKRSTGQSPSMHRCP